MSVFVLGSLHWDVVVDAPRLPKLGETLAGWSVDYRFGGKGGNQAVAAARMGAAVAMAGRVGDDAVSRDVLAILDAAGVDRSRVGVMQGSTGMSVAITEEYGDYGAVIVAGVNADNHGRETLPDGTTHCLIQSEIPESANLALARNLPPEVRLLVNAAPARILPEELIARADVLILNKEEARSMAGLSDISAAARFLRGVSGAAVIITLGPDGCLLADQDGDMRITGHDVEVISTHGAGDMFCGALAAELTRGADLRAAMAFANAAATLHVASEIGRRPLLSEADARTFLATF